MDHHSSVLSVDDSMTLVDHPCRRLEGRASPHRCYSIKWISIEIGVHQRWSRRPCVAASSSSRLLGYGDHDHDHKCKLVVIMCLHMKRRLLHTEYLHGHISLTMNTRCWLGKFLCAASHLAPPLIELPATLFFCKA